MFTRMFARKKAFSLVEILGGVAVAVTLATVAVVGVKDTVVSGQKAAAQQEIRQLNQALQNYKSAGGTIPTGALAGEVIDLLQAGVGLVSQEGEKYTPLVNDPPMQMSIGGEPYDLVYNDEDGFSYTPSSQVEGSSSGGPSGTQDPASYPFDINDDAATQDAFNAFQNLPYGDLARQQYLDAFNAAKAMGYLSPEELAQLETILAEDGLVLNVNGLWVDAPFNYQDLEATLDALGSLQDISPEDYEAYLMALKVGATANPDIASDINAVLVGEYIKAVNGTGNQGISWSSLVTGTGTPGVPGSPYNPGTSYTHYAVFDDPEYYNYFQDLWDAAAKDYMFANTYYEAPYDLSGHNLSGMNFMGSTFQNTGLQGTNLVGAKLPTSLATALLENANLSGQDLSNTDLTNTLLYGVDLTNVLLPSDLSNTAFVRANLSGKDLSASILPEVFYGAFQKQWVPLSPQSPTLSAFVDANLSGTILPLNLAGRSFAGATLGGQDFSSSNLVGTSFYGAKNLDTVALPTELMGTNLFKTNLSGKDFSTTNLQGAILSGANLAWTTLPTNLSNVALVSTDLSGRNFSGYNFSGASLNRANVNHASFSGATISATTRAPNNTLGTLDPSGNGTWFGQSVVNWVVQP